MRVQVRSAGEEAWLCREAPEDPVFDAPADEHLLRPLAMSAAEARIYYAFFFGGLCSLDSTTLPVSI